MYIHTLVCFCESRRRFSLFSPLNIYISLFFRSLPAPCLLPCSPPPLSRRKAIRVPLSSLPFCLPSACPPLLLLPCVPWLPCVVWRVPFRLPVPVACSVLSSVCSSHRARPEALRRPAVLSPLSGCPLVAAVTRPLSGAKRYDSVGRCSAYMSPALSPLAYVLPCVPLSVPCLVLWLVLPAAVCRLVVVIGGTPLCPGRLRCGAASVM